MATAKIATLAIRTLAKPIATQIKHQAANHHRFRGVCISLAQFMHRTEMALRSNLLKSPTTSSSASGGGGGSSGGSGEKAKYRPLNEAKAVTNGANALAEGFLFTLAAGLIMGESYRGSRSRAKQRDKTEEGLEELTLVTKALAEKIGLDYASIERRVKEMQEVQEAIRESEEGGDDSQSGTSGSGGDGKKLNSESDHAAEHAAKLRKAREEMERDRDRLQHAVNVLLRLALRSGWIQGQEGLHLQSILDGTDQQEESPPGHRTDAPDSPATIKQQHKTASDASPTTVS